MNNRLVALLIGVVIVLIAVLAFVLGQRSATTPSSASAQRSESPSPVAESAVPSARGTPSANPSAEPSPTQSATPLVLNAKDQAPIRGAKPFTETFDGVSLTFLPTKDFRKLIVYRLESINPSDDPSCTKVYTKRENVQNIDYAWDFVIKSFTTWSDEEGKQEYMVNEEDLPRAFQGSLHDIVRQGHSVTIDKQRCGMGQVEGLVSVRP